MSDTPPPPDFPGLGINEDDLRRILGGRSRQSGRSYLDQFMSRNFPDVTPPPRRTLIGGDVRRDGRASGVSKVWTIGIPYGTREYEAQLPIPPELVNWGYVFNDKKNAMIIVCATWDPADERRFPAVEFYDTSYPPRPTAEMVETAIFEVHQGSGDRALQVRLPAVYAGSAFVLGEVIHIIARPR